MWLGCAQFDIWCKGHMLAGKEHSLDFIVRTLWRSADRMELQFSLSPSA
jgi:hypothetical protein